MRLRNGDAITKLRHNRRRGILGNAGSVLLRRPERLVVSLAGVKAEGTMNHCSKCGAFVSRKRRIHKGSSTAILTRCRKCGIVLSWPFEVRG